VAAHVADRRRVAATVAFGLVAGIVGTAEQGGAFGELFGGLSIVVAPAFVGLVVRHTRDQARRLRELTWHLERERERSALAAVAEERTRIAREMHDVVAHGLSVVAIQADAAEAALARDPERAREPLRTIRSATAEALGEMRRLLGVLRAEGEPAELVPQPGLAQLPALLERARAAGVPAELEVVGTPRALPGGLDLSAYRIVQEALTNVGRHAPGAPAQVRLVWDPAALHVEVRDPGSGKPAAAPNGSGHGLVGLRERARLHGGSFAAGPAPGGGFAVTAVLPVEDA
jgi:signal transduction histidine kinase